MHNPVPYLIAALLGLYLGHRAGYLAAYEEMGVDPERDFVDAQREAAAEGRQ